MNNDLKYVIIQPIGMSKRHSRALIFNGMVQHIDAVSSEVRKRFTIVSAGFFKMNGVTIKCWGKSISLGIEGDHEFDEDIIYRTLNRTHPYL